PDGLPGAEALGAWLAVDFLAMGPEAIRSVESSIAPTRDYFAAHWPLFVPTADLEKALDALNRRVEEEGPFNLHLEDEEAGRPIEQDAPWLDTKQPLPRERIGKDFARYRDGFMVHPDGRSLTLVVRPAGTALGVAEARHLL